MRPQYRGGSRSRSHGITAPTPQPVGLAALKKPAYLQKTEISEKAERPKPTGEVQGPMAQSTFQKMKEQGYYRQQYFKEVECGGCHHKFKVGRSAKSTTCPSCTAVICMEDFDINVPHSIPIETRGDVMIRRNGNVQTTEIRCRDLKVQQGTVNASLFCSGDVTLKTVGMIDGEIRCHRLVVEKGSDVHFSRTVHANEMEIQAKVTGNIQCTGRVLLTSAGSVHGDVTARSISIEPGGELDGSMNILRSEPQTPRQVSASALVGGSIGPKPTQGQPS
jgi:cytoskeletal protein CcmA (bactofilin family)/ribosomal protein S27E